MFFFIFLLKMKIVHKTKKIHQNADELSRFQTYDDSHKKMNFSMTVIADNENFFQKIKIDFFNDKTFVKIVTKMKKLIENTKNMNENSTTQYQFYRWNIDKKLLYLKNKSNSDRLCVSASCHERIFKYAHDEHVHEEIKRTYNFFFRSIFIFKMKKIIIEYVISCSTCQFFKSSRLVLYDEFQSIKISTKSLKELSLNFILTLSMTSNNNNVILTITDRFSKWIKIISKNETMKTKNWSRFYWQHMIKNWSTSTKLISDRNFKFIFDFWTTIFQQCEATLGLTATYHSSTDDQAERSNQTIETTLRCLLMKKYEENWKNLLFQIKYALNTFENVSIKQSFFEMLYDIKSRNPLAAIVRKKSFEKKVNFLKNKKQIKMNAIDVFKMTQIKMIIQFDKSHKSFDLINKIYIKMTKTDHVEYSIPKSTFLTTKKIESFIIKRKVSFFAYELDFSSTMKIHSMISMIHLKQIKKNSFQKKNSAFKTSKSESIVIQNTSQYVIERVIRSEFRNDNSEFVIKWKKYKNITWKSEWKMLKNISNMIKKFQNRKKQ